MKKNFVKAIYRSLLPEKNKINEELIIRYYEDIQKNEQQDWSAGGKFDHEKVYNKILENIGDTGKTVSLIRWVWLTAACLLMFCTLMLLVNRYRYTILDYVSPIALQERKTTKGQVLLLKLTDGSKVWLNADSRLTFPENFRGDRREVNLEGEAFFDITHNSKMPFIIHSNNVTTQVLGTSFNVSAYPDDKEISVTVLTGKVGVTVPDKHSSKKSTLFITPNQQVVYNKGKKTASRDANLNASNVTAWKQGKLIYQSTSLSKIVADLGRKYNVTIRADENLLSCSLSANFNNEPLSKVLKVLSELVNGAVEMNEGSYLLKGQGCD